MTSKHFLPIFQVICFACLATIRVARGDVQPPSESTVRLPGFGLTFTAPAGWTRAPELNYSQLARFSEIKDAKLAGLLEVDTSPAKGRSAKDVAAKLAADFGGEIVSETPAGGAGKPTIQLRLAPTKQFAAYLAAVMPLRDQMVIFSLGESNPGDAQAALKGILASVAVSDPKPAASVLNLDKRPIALFDSAVLITLPEPFRPDKVANPRVESFFGARDWASGRDEASIQIQVMANPTKAPISQRLKGLAQSLTAKFKLQTPMQFSESNPRVPTYTSTVFSTKEGVSMRLVLATLDPSHYALLIFRATAPDAASRDKYMAMALEIARTARVSKDYQQGRQSVPSPTTP